MGVIATVSAVAGCFVALCTALGLLLRPVWKSYKELAAWRRGVDQWMHNMQKDITHGRNTDIMLLWCCMTALLVHRDNGVNGRVTKSIDKLDEYLIESAQRGYSHLEEERHGTD
jgi:hypothetical protein